MNVCMYIYFSILENEFVVIYYIGNKYLLNMILDFVWGY